MSQSQGQFSIQKISLMAFLTIVGIFITMTLWSLAGSLVSKNNDMAVLVGFVMYGGIVAALIGGGVCLYRMLCKQTPTVTPKQKKQRSTFSCFLLAFCFVAATAGGCAKVEPGYVGIKVNQYGNQRGVEDFPVVTGRVWYNLFTEDVYTFPTFLQNIVWTKDQNEGSPNDDSITFNSIEGAIINADIALSYGFDGEAVPTLFVEFRKSAEHITHVYMRSQVRDTFSRYASIMKVTDIFGAKKQELLENVKKDLIARLGPKGFRFDMISFVGGLRVDEKVQASINAVIEATQRAIEAENKVRQATAEANQRIETAIGEATAIVKVADAQAEANKKVAASLTPELVQWQAIQRWNGTLPQVTGTGGMPLIQIPSGNK